jgi:hypothetical protein
VKIKELFQDARKGFAGSRFCILAARVEDDVVRIDGQLWQDTIDFCKHRKVIRCIKIRSFCFGIDPIVERRVDQKSRWWLDKYAQGVHAYTFDNHE